MARGTSGRLVVDIDPELKKQFHAALTIEGTTFKDWLLRHVEAYLKDRNQPSLPGLTDFPQDSTERRTTDLLAAEDPVNYHSKQGSQNS